MTQNTENGFTLVELAIVLMIIGLLIGGVLRGQELLMNAQINATVRQVHAYEGAVVTFRDAYSQVPGDMVNATARIPGCDNSANHCGNGDGNSIVGTRLAGGTSQTIQTGTAVPAVETTYFWKHLALAHLISGVMPNADPAQPISGETHPAAKIAGVFMVGYGMHVAQAAEGLMLVLSNALTDSGNNGGAIQGVGRDPLTPRQAYQIDKKMDDGLPDTGSVSAPDFGQSCDNGLAYNLGNDKADQKGCILVFQMNA